MNTCPKCNTPLPSYQGRGRPPSYCSVGCRRAAEFELRRINNRLERLEDELDSAKHDRWRLHDCLGRSQDERVRDIEKAIADAELRLRALLGGEGCAETSND
jgi:hypothetical protein